jgi:hypothetical protein
MTRSDVVYPSNPWPSPFGLRLCRIAAIEFLVLGGLVSLQLDDLEQQLAQVFQRLEARRPTRLDVLDTPAQVGAIRIGRELHDERPASWESAHERGFTHVRPASREIRLK